MSEVKRYKTSPGWYEINDVTEYNGASVRLKPSYTSSTEFKADLEDKQKEVSKDIFRQQDNMSNASEVKRWETIAIDSRIPGTRTDVDSVPRVVVVSASEHDRIVAEKDAEISRLTESLEWETALKKAFSERHTEQTLGIARLKKELEALGLPTMPNGMAYQMYFTEEDIEKILTGLSCGEHEGFIDQEDADRIQDIIEKATKTK